MLGVGDAMRNVVRSTVRLVLSPILLPIRAILRRRARRDMTAGAPTSPPDEPAPIGRARYLDVTRRSSLPNLFAQWSTRPAPSADIDEGGPVRHAAEARGVRDAALLGTIEPLIARTRTTVSCRPAPTLADVTAGAAALDVAWTSGGLRFRGFGFAKERGELSEDAFAGSITSGAIALADGASSSWQAGEWALHLCESWAGSDGAWTADEHEARVSRARESFRDRPEAQDSGPAPWFTDEVSRRGAFTAFLGVAFADGDASRITYRVLSVGDACLLHYRGIELLESFPISSSADLNSLPELIASGVERRVTPPKESTGELRKGDVLLLVTDGIATGLLRENVEADLVRGLVDGSAENVRQALQRSRTHGEIPDDDLTLVRIAL